MNIHFILRRFLAAGLLAWMCWLPAAHGALLGLNPDGIPDAKAWNSILYAGNTTSGFHMDVDGFITAFDDGTGLSYPAGSCYGYACYTLDANFDGSGQFIDGTINIAYTPNHTTADGTILTSGNLVTGTLTNFGFGSAAPHTGTSGLFEFTFTITSGDYQSVWLGASGGTVIDTRGLKKLDGSDFSTGGATWDDYGLMTKQFKADLDGLTTSDTFVPVPAAVWLFGSGLMALVPMARRRRKQ